MNRFSTAEAWLKLVEGATITFDDRLEISLDCLVCRRCNRTIIFELGHDGGICIKTKHAFPGKLLSKRASHTGQFASVYYEISYEYEMFVDAKYPSVEPSGKSHWARISFCVTCPRCQVENQLSVQNNSVRPYSQRCQCGLVLYTEDVEMPVLTNKPND